MPSKKSTALATNNGGASSIAPNVNDLRTVLPVHVNETDATTQQELDAKLATATTAAEAFAILNGTAGLVPFANKAELAAAGTPFDVTRLAIRPDGGYTGDDDVAMTIVLRDSGQVQLLTFEQNPKRNQFLLGAHRVIERFGALPNACLQAYEKKDGTSFYAIVPAAMWTGDGSTIEGEVVEA